MNEPEIKNRIIQVDDSFGHDFDSQNICKKCGAQYFCKQEFFYEDFSTVKAIVEKEKWRGLSCDEIIIKNIIE